ncbi:MAG TPA: TIGR03435 family protein [Bryobacteraceae bacterium]
MRSAVSLVLIAAWAWAASAQEFEVVSVKPSKSLSNGSSTNSNQGRYTATNASLRNLIVEAYELRDYQVEGPEWLRSERYDIAATFPEALPRGREKYRADCRRCCRRCCSTASSCRPIAKRRPWRFTGWW